MTKRIRYIFTGKMTRNGNIDVIHNVKTGKMDHKFISCSGLLEQNFIENNIGRKMKVLLEFEEGILPTLTLSHDKWWTYLGISKVQVLEVYLTDGY